MCWMDLVNRVLEILFFASFPMIDSTTNDNISNNIEPITCQSSRIFSNKLVTSGQFPITERLQREHSVPR